MLAGVILCGFLSCKGREEQKEGVPVSHPSLPTVQPPSMKLEGSMPSIPVTMGINTPVSAICRTFLSATHKCITPSTGKVTALADIMARYYPVCLTQYSRYPQKVKGDMECVFRSGGDCKKVRACLPLKKNVRPGVQAVPSPTGVVKPGEICDAYARIAAGCQVESRERYHKSFLKICREGFPRDKDLEGVVRCVLRQSGDCSRVRLCFSPPVRGKK